METTVVKKSTFTLPEKKVLVVPVRRKGRWLPDNHEASFLFKHSYFQVVVPKDGRNGELKDPLTKEERDYFESKASGLALEKGDLSTLKRENNYWSNFRVKLDKNVLQLDLSNAMDYLRYKVLAVNTEIIAPSAEDKYAKGTYRFEKLIENDLLGFLKLADDKDYDKKVLIFTAQRAGALVREGMTFKIPDGAVIGDNLQEVITFFDNPANSEEVIKLKARIENSK